MKEPFFFLLHRMESKIETGEKGFGWIFRYGRFSG